MPEWLATLCIANTLSTPLLILAVISYLPNLYFNSNSTVFRKKKEPEPGDQDDSGKTPIAFSPIGVKVNMVLAVLSAMGIWLTFNGC